MNIIITGASKGLGLAIATSFAAEGHTLLLSSRTQKDLAAVVVDLEKLHINTKVMYKATDLSNKENCIAFGNWCLQQVTTIDILVNNVGFFIPGSIHSEADGQLEAMLNANLLSAYHITRGIVPNMMANKVGTIFNITSIAGVKPYANGGSYSISKYALQGFSKNLREELKPYNIKVSTVIPGAVYTDSWSGSGVDPKRIMEADDIAKMIVAATKLSAQAVLEDIVLRPQLGDL